MKTFVIALCCPKSWLGICSIHLFVCLETGSTACYLSTVFLLLVPYVSAFGNMFLSGLCKQLTWHSHDNCLCSTELETCILLAYLILMFLYRAGRYEVDGYVYDSNEEPKLLMTGKWNESLSYQPCDVEGEPMPGTELKEVKTLFFFFPF